MAEQSESAGLIMNYRTIVSLLLCMAVTGCASITTDAPLLLVADVVIKPSLKGDYESVTKEISDLYREYGFSYPTYVYSTDGSHYYLVFPLSDYGEMDDFFKATTEFVEKINAERYQELHRRVFNTFDYYRYFTLRFMPELSCSSQEPMPNPEGRELIHWTLFSVQSDKEEQATEILKELADQHKLGNGTDEYDLFWGEIGMDMPFFVTKRREKKESAALQKTLQPLLRKYDENTGTWRPDLSYIPKE